MTSQRNLFLMADIKNKINVCLETRHMQDFKSYLIFYILNNTYLIDYLWFTGCILDRIQIGQTMFTYKNDILHFFKKLFILIKFSKQSALFD